MTIFRCERLWVGLPAFCLVLLCVRDQQLAPGGANQQLGSPGHANGGLFNCPPWQFQGSMRCSVQHLVLYYFLHVLNIPSLSISSTPFSAVNLVELYDAARSVCAGAAPDAAETEAAARPRQHEPATLRAHRKTHLCQTWFNRRGETPQAPIGNFRHYLRVEAGDGERCEATGSKWTARLTDEGRAALSSPLSLSLTLSVSLPVPLWQRGRASTWPVTLLST